MLPELRFSVDNKSASNLPSQPRYSFVFFVGYLVILIVFVHHQVLIRNSMQVLRSDLHENLFQGRLIDLRVLDAEAEGRVLQQLEHRRELPLGLRLRHEDGVLVRVLVVLPFNPDILLSRLLVRVYKLIEPLFLLDLQLDTASCAKSFRQEGSAALANKLTCRHNTDSVAEDFSFVHVMRC